jgi:hypothetical protein
MCGTLLSGFFCSVFYTAQNNLKPKNIQLTPIPNKMQQADAAVSNRETKCLKVGTLRVIQIVTQQRILIA